MPHGPPRAELDELLKELQKISARQDAMAREQEIQLQRIAELQADIDLIRAAWTKTRNSSALRGPGTDS